MSDTLAVESPAKINLALSLGAPIPPRNMHPIATSMVTLDLFDTLILHKAQGATPRLVIRYGDDALGDASRCRVDWPLEQDLAMRALRLLDEHVGRTLPITAELIKRIPTGAGLGGGSGNGAAMMAGVNQLLQLGIDTRELMKLAGTLGSDMPFFVAAYDGMTSAIVRGCGEIIEPLPIQGAIHAVLIFPAQSCPTGPIYQAFDRLSPDCPAQPDDAKVARVTQKAVSRPDQLFNDLQSAAADHAPELATLLKRLHEAGLDAHITGSGSTLFSIQPDRDSVIQTARRISQLLDLPTYPVTGPYQPRMKAMDRVR
ncbi:MAG: hypothetical protein JJU36_13360 [Phycisphaeraceae bacterium]|nr:hypothetical protein [Phycisphaeraceae bacterium]